MSEDFDRAVADHLAGKFEAAAKVYRRLLDVDPGNADAWHLLGLTLHQRGQSDLAIQTIQRALLLKPRIANFHNSLGMALHGAGDATSAARALQTAVTLDPQDADAHNNLGMVYTDLKHFVEAESALRRALAIRPDHQGAIYNLGRVLAWQGDDGAALEYLRDACSRDPNNPTYWNTLGVTLNQLCEFAEGRSAFQRAVELDPQGVDAHVNLAHDYLREGEFERGWPEHEWRLQRPEFRRRMRTPPWRGGRIAGDTVLLWAEQGLGDAIQFIRYAPHVAARGARVVVEAPETLHGLFRAVAGVSEVVPPGGSQHCQNHVALLSLPMIFGMLPADEPYLRAPRKMTLERSAGRRVGLVWAGNPAHSNDRKRSHELADFAPLYDQKAAFFSLQVGPAAESEAPAQMPLTRLGERFRDFSDTAAALAALDLLVTVDTSVAHLAGALGVPTWLILPPNPDWRWGREGDRTVWYPAMRLFRQAPGEDNKAVFERLAKALAAEL